MCRFIKIIHIFAQRLAGMLWVQLFDNLSIFCYETNQHCSFYDTFEYFIG